MDSNLLLIFGGVIAGFIDSVAGGGGLITLPLLTLTLEAGAHAIGTNKVAGTLASLVALLVYARHGHLNLKVSLWFVVFVGLGSFLGSLLTPLLPGYFFKYLLLVLCPVILFIVWNKDRWTQLDKNPRKQSSFFVLVFAGVLCGFYDGAFGPGGGTFMLLALVFFAGRPVMESLAMSKLANFVSASTSLLSYSVAGYVHWNEGAVLGLSIASGALVGSHLASKKAAGIVRPVLACVVVLLIARLLYEFLGTGY